MALGVQCHFFAFMISVCGSFWYSMWYDLLCIACTSHFRQWVERSPSAQSGSMLVVLIFCGRAVAKLLSCELLLGVVASPWVYCDLYKSDCVIVVRCRLS